MRSVYVEPKRTPMAFTEAENRMRWALKYTLGAEPTDEALALALAKTALETGRWTAIWNGNWGNWKADATWDEMFTCIVLNEVIEGKLVWFAPEGQLSGNPAKGGKLIASPIAVPDGHPQTRMRAFPGNTHGVEVYTESMARGRYREAWGFLLQGDAVAYVHSLKTHGYFTADEALYRKGVVSLQREMLTRLRAEEPPVAVDIEWEKLKLAVPQLQFDVSELLSTPAGNDFAEAVA